MSIRITLGIAAALLCAPAWAQPLVDAAWLAQHREDRDLVVLHVGEAAGYAKGHIPGARQLAVGDVSRPNEGDRDMTPAAVMAARELLFELPSVEALRAKLESLGVGDRSRIVLYGDPAQPLPAVTRVAHVLGYLGLGARTSILDGNLAAWTRAGHATTTAPTAVTPGKLTPEVVPSMFVDAEFVRSLAHRPGYKLVDARAPAFFTGLEPTFGKAGHIPGAVNIPFNEVSDDTQRFPRERVAALFRAAGVKPGDKLVVYCHLGMQATEVILGARLLGFEASLYDGSFQDWALHARGPVER